MPTLLRQQKALAGRTYRAVAVEMSKDPARATSHRARAKGWRQAGRISRDGAEPVPWGHAPVSEDEECVWCGGDSSSVACANVPRIDPSDVVFTLRLVVGSAAFACVLLTTSGVVFFLRAMKIREDFLAATAHDLMSPVVAMRQFVGRDDEVAAVLAERVQRLVQNIADFMRLGGRRPTPTHETFAVREAMNEAYRLFAEDFADEKSGPVEISGDAGVCVCADRILFLQIVWNLLGNALKYAAPYGPVRMEVSRRRDGIVALSVLDAGPGMTPSQRRKAFRRYYRARTARTLGCGGYGIGLCTAREFARAMGGDLTVSANHPSGCVFTLTVRGA